MASLIRQWRVWAGRWFSSPPDLDISYTVQPVVLLDDVRDLQLPPIAPMFGAGGASAPQHLTERATLLFYCASRKVLQIRNVRCSFPSGNVYWGVRYRASNPPPVLTASDIWTPEAVQSPFSSNKSFRDGQFETGSTPTFMLNDATPQLLTTVEYDLGIYVLPGQYAWFQHDTVNVTLQWQRFIWRELEVELTQTTTSEPRGDAGVG